MIKRQRGFTLIELLIVIGIIAILAAAVIVAINPGQQFEQARNSTRRSHLSSVASAIHSWAAMENDGTYPDCIEDGTWNDIDGFTECEGTDESDTDEGDALEVLLSDYINELPTPPEDPDEDYEVQMDGGNLELRSDEGGDDEFDEVIAQ